LASFRWSSLIHQLKVFFFLRRKLFSLNIYHFWLLARSQTRCTSMSVLLVKSRLVWRTHDPFLLRIQTSHVSRDNRCYSKIGVTKYMIRDNTITVTSNCLGNTPDYECLPNKTIMGTVWPYALGSFNNVYLVLPWSKTPLMRTLQQKPVCDVCSRFSYCKDLSLGWSRMYGFIQSIWRFINPLRWQETECPNLTAAHRKNYRRQ
jgi:hypothetical protein